MLKIQKRNNKCNSKTHWLDRYQYQFQLWLLQRVFVRLQTCIKYIILDIDINNNIDIDIELIIIISTVIVVNFINIYFVFFFFPIDFLFCSLFHCLSVVSVALTARLLSTALPSHFLTSNFIQCFSFRFSSKLFCRHRICQPFDIYIFFFTSFFFCFFCDSPFRFFRSFFLSLSFTLVMFKSLFKKIKKHGKMERWHFRNSATDLNIKIYAILAFFHSTDLRSLLQTK